MNTPTFYGHVHFYWLLLTDTVESVAGPDWRKGCVYALDSFGPHTYLQSMIFMTMPTNDGGGYSPSTPG